MSNKIQFKGISIITTELQFIRNKADRTEAKLYDL